MTSLRAPRPSRLTRVQHLALAWTLTLLALAAVVLFGWQFWHACLATGTDLLHGRVRTPKGLTTWGALLNADTPSLAVLKCQFQNTCSAWFGTALALRFDLQTHAAAPMVLLAGMVLAWRAVPSPFVRKDPGQGRWFALPDPRAIEVIPLRARGRVEHDRLVQEDARNPRSFYLGHVLPWEQERRDFAWRKPVVGWLRERDRCEHVLILGAPGSGKTRGMIRQNIILDAVHGRTAIVFDLKWPQAESGFADLILYWHRRGRKVAVFTPFSPTSMRLPLLEGIDSFDEALRLARVIIPPPEHGEEVGGYYKDTERRALAAMILAIAQGPTPNMKELQRLGQMNHAELESWYTRQTNPEITGVLKGLFDQRKDQLSGTLAGIVNKLQVFHNPFVSRATTVGEHPEEVIDLHRLFREGGLLVVGIEAKHVLGGEGELLLQLIKRQLDQALLDVADTSQGGRLPITATYYLDELPSLGRVPHLMENLATLRSKNVCLMLGVQNSAQGVVVYGPQAWSAITLNNIGTRVAFIRGTTFDEAQTLSKEAGEGTVEAESTSTSAPRFSSPWSDATRAGESVKLEKRPLLSMEEIRRAPRDLAVVFTKGHNPLLVATPALETKVLETQTFDGRHVRLRNDLHDLWTATMSEVQDVGAELRALLIRLGTTRSVDTSLERVRVAPEYWQDWLAALLEEGAMIRRQPAVDKLKVMLRRDTLPEALSRERDLQYFLGEGWLSEAQDERELTITQDGLAAAGKLLTRALGHFVVTGPALYWARTHLHDVLRNEAADPGEGRYHPETLSVSLAVAEDLYGLVPDLPHVDEDGETRIVLPLSDPAALEAALERARTAPRPALETASEDAPDAEASGGPEARSAGEPAGSVSRGGKRVMTPTRTPHARGKRPRAEDAQGAVSEGSRPEEGGARRAQRDDEQHRSFLDAFGDGE